MPSRFQYAVLLMVVGSLLIVVPILHGPITTEPSYEYGVEETTAGDQPWEVAYQAPNVTRCVTHFSARGCLLEQVVAAEEPETYMNEFDGEVDAGTRESDTIYMLGVDEFVRPIATHDGNGTVTLTHEPVTEAEVIEAGVVDEDQFDHSEAAIESIESGHVTTDEPIEIWEDNRIVEYEGSYYQMVTMSHQQPTETTYMAMTRFVIVMLGFWMLLYGRKVQLREPSP
ncbi:hypothetical protein [Halostagnicola kamekurae]|uniref:Uncharacterized protein n=1 Tax=Halostagnicola kamekurae TaxID=619731 RepID=A0A1I6RU62_9EURY|nr:hypothetical protein [Halostagnicola kamekurae]SFS68212.1 hypothetical protein SAMN04488556_2124 [Halostagnicola kamekurae]